MINILVVDDLDLVRRSIISLLSDADGINVIGEAESGEKALDLVKKLSPHVVLLDLRLPDISGLEVTHKILKHEPKTKILILTAYKDAVYPARLLHAGVFGYLTSIRRKESRLCW
jgi:two-component system invasion response regulator UvrY